MILRSFARYAEMVEFDTSSGRIRGIVTESGDPSKIAGDCEVLGETVAALYRQGGELILQIDRHAFRLSGDVRVSHIEQGAERKILITGGAAGTIEVCYRIDEESDYVDEDQTPFVEPEHFDFGLYLANIASDPSRADRAYR